MEATLESERFKKLLKKQGITIPFEVYFSGSKLGYTILVETPWGQEEIKEVIYDQGLFGTRWASRGFEDIVYKTLNIQDKVEKHLLEQWKENQ
tara:strand:+ start:1633 stop:1911 length:279 start_codon:yes stop_codon:yes gene_type:complete